MSSGMTLGFLGAGAFLLMLSRASLLFILKSGCLNSQAYNGQLCTVQEQCCDNLTPTPYGEVPPSSLLCRTLWKSYLFSWRTKLAKLLCLKCFGRMCFVNFSFCEQVSAVAPSVIHSPAPHCALHVLVSLPPALRSCLLRYPSVLRSRLEGSPASCGIIVSRRAGAIAIKSLTCIVCEPGSVSRRTAAAHCRHTYKVA